MREKIVEKLDSEWELFFLESVRNSKANIFAKSYEIETKKQIQKYIRNYVKNDKKFDDSKYANRIYLMDNIMDACYRYVKDHPEQLLEETCKEYFLK